MRHAKTTYTIVGGPVDGTTISLLDSSFFLPDGTAVITGYTKDADHLPVAHLVRREGKELHYVRALTAWALRGGPHDKQIAHAMELMFSGLQDGAYLVRCLGDRVAVYARTAAGDAYDFVVECPHEDVMRHVSPAAEDPPE